MSTIGAAIELSSFFQTVFPVLISNKNTVEADDPFQVNLARDYNLDQVGLQQLIHGWNEKFYHV